jgi:predicted small lipoprotein YifL
MKQIKLLALLLALLAMAACGGSKAADKSLPDEKAAPGQTTSGELTPSQVSAAMTESAGGPADFLRVSAVRLGPDDINAAVDINAEVDVVPPVPDGVAFEYRWYVNNQEVADAIGSTLPKGNFRKNQWIICEARAKAGGKTSGWFKSNWVRVANSPPHIEPVAADKFTLPGRFSCQFKAGDIDSDELSFELISPLDSGIELDKKSGMLTWDLDEKIVAKLGETIEIKLSVSDSDAKPTTASLTLNFQKKKQ